MLALGRLRQEDRVLSHPELCNKTLIPKNKGKQKPRKTVHNFMTQITLLTCSKGTGV
jgi:hypothetical protein